MHPTVFWTILLLSSFSSFAGIEASLGDRSYDFQSCVSRCVGERCRSSAASTSLEVPLRLMWWTCRENCSYTCMRSVTADDVRLNRPIRQFYGKWPFIRFYGIQEPASVLFSLLNGATVTVGYVKYSRVVRNTYDSLFAVQCQFWVNLNAWLWSTIFHSRDFPLTEKLDYFSAGALIVAGLVVQFVRITGPSARLWHAAYTALWLLLYAIHVSYLSFYRFDYGYNMAASVCAGTLYTVIWLIWCLKHWRERPYVWKCALVVLCTSCFLLLELLDFPPIAWVLDAHSLWHLSTIPLPLIWYSFLTDDANFQVQEKFGKQV